MAITVLEEGRELQFSFDELLGDGAPVERTSIAVATPFGGPGARDGFELVLRTVRDARYLVDAGLAREERGPRCARFVFAISRGPVVATVLLREGFVTGEFLAAVAATERSPTEEERFAELKLELADRVMGASAAAVYDVEVGASAGSPHAR